MKEILMYISIAIKVIILIILIAILFKITSVSSIKTIEKFQDYEPDLNRAAINARMDKTLTQREYKFLNESNTAATNEAYLKSKDAKLSLITESEINDLITTFRADARRVTEDLKILSKLSKPFPEKTITFPNRPSVTRQIMDKSKILDYLQIISDNFDTIKRLTDNIIEITNHVRYMYYYYYITYWDEYFTSAPRSNYNVYANLYSKLTTPLYAISNAETSAIDLYLHAKGFLNMKEGTQDVYRCYIENKDRIYNDFITGDTYTDKIMLSLSKTQINNCGISYTRNNGGFDPINSANFKLYLGASFFYIWRVYDYKLKKYIAEGEKPNNVILKDKSTSSCTPSIKYTSQ